MLTQYINESKKIFCLNRKATKYKNKMNKNILTEEYPSGEKGTDLMTWKKKIQRDNVPCQNPHG